MKLNFENTYIKLPENFYQRQNPQIVKYPELYYYNHELARELGIGEFCDEKEKAIYLSGNKLFDGSEPIAQVYAGHQFGYFSSRLGDGRAILLGEMLDIENKRRDIVLKGSGKTLFSRGGDGKATLGSVVREYLMSEAMYYLGIPTTRSLSIVGSGEKVFREDILPGGVLTRVASSHIRFGTFEYFFHNGDMQSVRILADYSIHRHYPEINNSENKYIDFFKAVMNKQMDLVINWMRVGFIHGVMNTDNMLICGETIDYGPCAFMDHYDKNTVFSSIDQNGRYSFENQKHALNWNLYRFGETMIPLFSDDIDTAVKLLEHVLHQYESIFDKKYFKMMHNKIGIFEEAFFDKSLVFEILEFLEKNQIDYTDFFRYLTQYISENNMYKILQKYDFLPLKTIIEKLEKILNNQSWNFDEIGDMMKKINPYIIPRNYKIEYVINKIQRENDFEELEKLCKVLKTPYSYNQKNGEYLQAPSFINKNYKTFCGT